MNRCSMRFSTTGILVKIQAGSIWPCRSPSENTTQTAKAKPKNQRRRSRQNAARPATITRMKLQPRKAAEARGAPSYPPSARKTLWRGGYVVVTKLDGMNPPITPTLGQTKPERWAGPSRANQTGQARRTTPTTRPTANAFAACGARARSASRLPTSAASSSPTTQKRTTTATIASISEDKKNCPNKRRPSNSPAPSAPWRWRIRISSRTARMSGSSIRAAVMRWANSKLPRTKGEKPKSNPPMKAAGVQDTHRRRTTNAVKAVSAGAMVEATFSDAMGPQIHVTGTSGMLSPVTEVCASRLIPVGWKSADEKNGFCPCDSAVAGHWKNQRNSAGSPQPHRVWVEAPWVHAWIHRTNPRAR